VNDLTEVKIRKPTARSEFVRINVIRARRNNPCATQLQIANRYGITRERVRQILKEAEKPTAAYKQIYLCPSCGKELPSEKQLRARQGKVTFCNKQCRYDYGHIKVACDYCGNLKEYRVGELISHIRTGNTKHNHFFCSRVCQGKWLGENYGKQRKWDWSMVYELRDSTGWGSIRIGRALDIPFSTVSEILDKRYRTE